MPLLLDPISPVDSWYYSDRAGVQTLIDQTNVAVGLDMNDDGTEDAGLMLADGLASDGYIDLFLANEGVAIAAAPHIVNLKTAPAYVVQALADVSNHLTVWYGWHHRGLQESDGTRGKALAGIMSGYKEYADAQLDKLANVLTGITNGTQSATGMVRAVVGSPKQYPGTGCVRPFAVTVPSINGNASW
jgi:hypothetical protein